MIKVVKIESEGGACPYQVEAVTDDNRPVYARYRHGHLRVVLVGSVAADYENRHSS